MRVKIGGSVISYRRILYGICFLMFCVIDQRIRTAFELGGWLETFRELTGAVMAVIILSHYKLRDFKKWKLPYILWSVIGGGAGIAAFIWGTSRQVCLKHWFVILLDIFLFGYVVIHTVIDAALEKRAAKLNKKFAAIWLLMMVLMAISRSEQIWPLCYLVMFGCFYLTDYDQGEREDMFQGMLDGVIAAFFLIQGLAFVFRPYDEVRYRGLYFNTNMNALFYLEVLAAVLSKLLLAIKRNAGKWWKLYYWLGVGVVLSFLFMTIGRTAWIVAIALVAVFLWATKKGAAKRSILKQGMLVILCACLTFPACFGAARYFPPLFHHPVWFGNEWNERRVHSWDPWDSEKYVSMEELFDAAIGRVLGSFRMAFGGSAYLISGKEGDAADESALTSAGTTDLVGAVASAGTTDLAGAVASARAADEKPEKADGDEYDEGARISIMARLEIYRYYISRLNLWGNAKRGDDSWGWHGHNIFLQYGTDFGLIMLALFLVVCGWNVAALVYRFLKSGNERYVCVLFFLLVTLLYGMFELSVGAGGIGTIMMFFAWGGMIRLDTGAETG